MRIYFQALTDQGLCTLKNKFTFPVDKLSTFTSYTISTKLMVCVAIKPRCPILWWCQPTLFNVHLAGKGL